jgi:hypothetical protein
MRSTSMWIQESNYIYWTDLQYTNGEATIRAVIGMEMYFWRMLFVILEYGKFVVGHKKQQEYI